MKAILLAFSLFSRIPVPQAKWDGRGLRYALAAFPLVGAVIGLAVVLWDMMCASLAVGPLLRGAGFALVPIALTGGIHLDGFCDTVDALACHGDMAKRQAVLRDPHIGTFAVVAVCAYIVLFAALGSEFPATPRAVSCLGLLFVLSRSLCGLALVHSPRSPHSALAAALRDAVSGKATSVILGAAATIAAGVVVLLGGWAGVAAMAAMAAAAAYCRSVALRQFGGMSGDLAGWLLQVCEAAAMFGFVLGMKL